MLLSLVMLLHIPREAGCFAHIVSGMVGWCDGAGLTSSAGASYTLDYSRTKCGWGLYGCFNSHLSFLSSLSLSLSDDPTEILSQRAVKPKTTNQPNHIISL